MLPKRWGRDNPFGELCGKAQLKLFQANRDVTAPEVYCKVLNPKLVKSY